MRQALLAALLLPWVAWTAFGQDDFVEGTARPQTVSIGRMPKPPALDGSLAGWPADSTSIVLGSEKNGVRRHFNWTGTRDLSAVVRLAWDDDALYLAEDVCDDQLVQATNEKEIYQGDSIELFFNSYPGQYRVDGFRQIAIAPQLVAGAKLLVVGAQKPFEGVEGNTKVYTGGYTFECRIPWKNLPGFTPGLDHYLGFQVMLDDCDSKGRKSQQIWYPGAITYSQPTYMNTLRLAFRGDTALPHVAAGPNTWCVTDPKKLDLSVIADVPGAESATISLLAPRQAEPSPNAPSLTVPLEAIGPRVKVAQGSLTGIDDLDGLAEFAVTVTGTQGQVLATQSFQTELSAKPFARIKELAGALPKRLDALALKSATDPMALAGLTAWMKRCQGLIGNEASSGTVSRWLLDQLVEEMNALDAAVARCEAGKNPYENLTGSFIEAYPSPLTGNPRPLALLIPKDYDPKADKRWPLIFLLHGIFGDERQLTLMAGRLRDLGAIVCQAPSYRLYDWGGINAAESWAGFDKVLGQYKIDPDRIYLIGHAVGGRGVWQLAEGRPDLWAACAPLLSGADTGPKWDAVRLYPQYLEQANAFQVTYPLYHAADPPLPFTSPVEKELLERASLASRVDNIAGLPIRNSYGEESPDSTAERLAMFDRFIELGAPLDTHQVPGAGHGAVAEEWRSPAFYRWLLSHRRPATPAHVVFVANGLRYNTGWWVTVDRLDSPSALGRIDATLDGDKVDVKTSGLSAFTLNPKDKPAGDYTVTIDGQPGIQASGDKGLSFVRDDGQWKSGSPKLQGKRHGLSGPIDDFQFDRFMVVFGTQGDPATNTLLAKIGKRLSEWGMQIDFECKADRDVTDDDLHQKHLIVIGTPENNSILAKMKDALPIKWDSGGLSLGSAQVSGSGAGLCAIQPNPLAPEHYVVVVSANDEGGYGVWAARGPSDDYLLGNAGTTDGKPSFAIAAHGCFDNEWNWKPEDCVVTH